MHDNNLASALLKGCAKGELLKHHELVKESLALQNVLTLLEPTDHEIIFESND